MANQNTFPLKTLPLHNQSKTRNTWGRIQKQVQVRETPYQGKCSQSVSPSEDIPLKTSKTLSVPASVFLLWGGGGIWTRGRHESMSLLCRNTVFMPSLLAEGQSALFLPLYRKISGWQRTSGPWGPLISSHCVQSQRD